MSELGEKVTDIGGQGLSAFHADVPVTIQGNQFVLDSTIPISGFALLDSGYRDPEKSAEELQRDREERSRLMDKVEPVTRPMLRKGMEIVGWSPNLIKNSSGEVRERTV